MSTAKEMTLEEKLENAELVTSCCGAAFNSDIQMCPDCKEHCGGVYIDENGEEIATYE